MNIRYGINILGKILLLISLFMLTIVPWIFHFHEEELLKPIFVSILIPMILGSIIILLTRNYTGDFRIKEAYLIVSLTWIIMGIIGSLPYYLTNSIPSFIDSLFESISGFTTTGSSILTDVEAIPKSILYWRSLTHWIGGMGIIVLIVAIFPKLNIAGYKFFQLESSGIMPQKIKPRASSVAKSLWIIYVSLTFIVIILLMFDGISFYESLCHSFGTIATGGFSTKNASIGHYSTYAQYVIMIFMLLSGINFSLHYFLLHGNYKRILKNSELKVYLLIILLVGTILSFILYFQNDIGFEKSFRDSFFQVISIITATGYSTADYLNWEEYAWILLFGLMFIGASVGSTGGGIKVIRHVVALKSISNYFTKIIHPNSINTIKINGNSIPNEKAHSIISFNVIYLIIFAISSLIMSSMGLDLNTSIGSVITTMGGIGPGIGTVGPASNFAHIPDFGKLLLSFLMILGRLEILTILVIFIPGFWKK
jgi:trk system potassium uptake protein TrkH